MILSLMNKLKCYIGNALMFLFVLVIMIDPTNGLLHLKDKVFIAVVAYCVVAYKIDIKYLAHVLLPIVAIAMSYVLSIMQGNIADMDEVLAAFKSIMPLIMLLWIKHFNVIKIMGIPAVLVCVISITCWLLMLYNPVLESIIYKYNMDHDATMQMSKRTIMGVQIFGCYYKSFVSIMFVMFSVIYGMLNTQKTFAKFGYIILFVIFMFVCAISGTRSTMLLPFAMIGMASYRQIMAHEKVRYLLLPILFIFFVVFLGVVFMLASETSEYSNSIKYAHVGSYIDLFIEHPQYLLFGQGPGTEFYTEGFRAYVVRTEWTYLDLVRNYGIGSLMIMSVFIFPLWRLRKSLSDNYVFGIYCTYIIYLFIAGTNPLLMSSTGMAVILAIYSFMENYDNNEKNVQKECC